MKKTFSLDGLTYNVRHNGTADCEVRFRLSREKMAKVREYYTRLSGIRGQMLQFTSCEILDQGHGWYLAICRNDKADGALHAVYHVVSALKIIAGDMRPVHKAPKINATMPDRYIIKAKRTKFGSWTLVNLVREAAINRFEELTSKPVQLTKEPERQLATPGQLHKLLTHFAH